MEAIMQFNQPITSIIKQRHSVRTFSDKAIEDAVVQNLTAYINKVTKPHDQKIRIQLLSAEVNQQKIKLGTYGVIKGAHYYLGGVIKNEGHCYETLGYVLEQIVLYCTSLGLGTVWLGGTYSKSQFAKAINLQPNEDLAIVIPVGYEASKKSFIASLIGDNSHKRKTFGDLFFDKDTSHPLKKESASPYAEALEMLRRAPSAVNAQPWRVIKEGNTLHFYIINSKSFHSIDIGIGLSHFHLTAMEQGIAGEFFKKNPAIECPFEYVVSWH